MTQSFYVLCQMSIMVSLFSLLVQRNHFLMALLSLEGVMLSIVLFIPISMYAIGVIIPSISIVLLTFGVCEASLGLSLMVYMSRSCGSDHIMSLSLNKC